MPSSYTADDVRAELQDLWALLRLAQAGSAQNSTPLSRYRFIDGGTTAPAASQNGAIGSPFSTITKFMNAIGVGTSAADSQAVFLGKPTPCLNGYTETVTFPSRRNTEIRADSAAINGAMLVTGNAVWANTAAAGGVAPTTAAVVLIHNVLFSGTGTFTDDGTVVGEVIISGDETDLAGIGGAFTATGCTDLNFLIMDQGTLNSTLTSTATATGLTLETISSNLNGAVVCKNIVANLTFFNGNITVASAAAGGAPFFHGCTFATSPVLTGGAGTIANFDGTSWFNFLRAGGTLSTCIVLVAGGYSGGPVAGANLTNANVSVGLNGTGATAGFTTGGNWYTLPAATLTGAHTVTLLTGAGELPGDTILITRNDVTANTYTVINGGGGGGNVGVLPINVKGSILAEFNGTNWVLAEGGSDFT